MSELAERPGHAVTFRRYQRGMTPIRPSRPVYGYRIVCECGWEMRCNNTLAEAHKMYRDHAGPMPRKRA